MQSCKFEQSSCTFCPVDETVVNGVNNTFPQNPQHLILPSNLPPPYPIDPDIKRNSVVSPRTSQPHISQGQLTNPQDNRIVSSVPALDQGYSSSLDGPSNNPLKHTAHFYTDEDRHPTSSFSINQHIGLNEPPVVNASQLNNSIKVQYQFNNNDRFVVQSTSTRESSDSVFLSWQSLSDSYCSKKVTKDLHTLPKEPDIVSENNYHKSSHPSKCDQYHILNILRKNDANVSNSSKVCSSHLNNLEVERDYTSQTFEIGNGKQKNQSVNTYNKGIEISKQNNDRSVKSLNTNEVINVDEQGKVERLVTGQNKNTNKLNVIDINHDRPLSSSIKIQSNKTETLMNTKTKSKTTSVKKRYKRTDISKKDSISTGHKSSCEITLRKVTYQCGECPNVFFNIENLVKHLEENHTETQIANETADIKSNTNVKTTEKIVEIYETEDNINCESNESIEENLRQMEGTGDEAMVSETVGQELMEVESENMVSEPECLLCPLCAYASKSVEEEERHQRTHDAETETDKTHEKHIEGEGYITQYLEMVENRQKNEEKRGPVHEKVQEEDQASACRQNVQDLDDELNKKQTSSGPKSKKVSDKSDSTIGVLEDSPEKNKSGLRKRQATQAKNSLMNPSKGKQKRVRDMQNLCGEDRMLMEMFGIIPSKVCLSRVENSDNLESQNRKSSIEEHKFEIENLKTECENFKDSATQKKKIERNHWSKVLNMSNCKEEESSKENTSGDEAINSDDSDVEIVEPPMTLIVLDDEINMESEIKDDFSNVSHESIDNRKKGSPKKPEKESPKKPAKGSPKKSEKVTPKKIQKDSPKKPHKGSPAVSGKKGKECISPRNVSIDFRKGKDEQAQETGKRSKSDAELLDEYGIKDLTVNVTNTLPNKKQSKPGQKLKYDTRKRQLRESKSTSNALAKDIEKMSPSEIEKLLYECGMGITVPVQAKISRNEKESPDRVNQTPSPVPSTSKGHGNLKRKRTARKSTKDSALFKKYKLKDSKVIIENLSRIDISLIRNPNSPFGKSDWLKHKFDSDTESDFEFDIPTPPLVEDFVESAIPPQNDIQKATELNSQSHTSVVKTGRKSPWKQRELQEMEKYGISESVVVIDSPKKSQNVIENKPIKKKAISDEELRKKFGIPNTMVVINTPEKSTCTSGEQFSENKHSHISFGDFALALDRARKNILSSMKADIKPDLTVKRRNSSRNTMLSKQTEKELITKSKKKVEQNKNDTAFKSINSNDESGLVSRKLRGRSNVNETASLCVLPQKPKTLTKTKTVDIIKMKSNETRKIYKAKAVSRAIDVKHKKNKITKELDDNGDNGKNKGKQTMLSSSRKKLGEKVSEKCEKSRKTKCSKSKRQDVRGKETKFTKDIQVVKTARYKRSFLASKTLDKTCRKLDLKELAKGLPNVKVSVPCLTDEQIVRLTHNMEDSPVSRKNDIDLTSDAVAKEIINEIINKICLSYDFSCENNELSLSDHVENIFEGDTLGTKSGSGEKNVNESDFTSGANESYSLIEDVEEEDNLTSDARNIDNVIDENDKDSEKTDGLHSVDDSESNLLLTATSLENKENENDTVTHVMNEGSNDDNVKTGVDKKTSQTDVIPFGWTKLYDEEKNEFANVNMCENSHDEVDGDIIESTRLSQENYGNVETGKNVKETEKIVENKDVKEKQQSNESEQFVSDTDDVNEEKENRNDDEICESEIHTVENSKTFKDPVTENDNVSKDNSGIKMQILSAIIESESGSLIGDVYSVSESTGNCSDGNGQEKRDKKEMDFSIDLLENVSRLSRSSSPEEIIETLTES